MARVSESKTLLPRTLLVPHPHPIPSRLPRRQSLESFSADPDRDWEPAFAVLDDPLGLLHKLVRASDLTVCVDRYCTLGSMRRRSVEAFEVRVARSMPLVQAAWENT